MPSLYLKYAPKDFQDFVGNATAVAKVRRVIERPDFDGGVFLFTGPSGLGKTTLANILAERFGKLGINIMHLDGDRCDVHAAHELEYHLRVAGWAGGFRVVIVNEAHNVKPLAGEAFKTLMDKPPRKSLIIFTTDRPHQFALGENALFSRLYKIALAPSPADVPAIAVYLKAIAEAEGLDGGTPLAAYAALVTRKGFNIRECLTAIELGEVLDEGAAPMLEAA